VIFLYLEEVLLFLFSVRGSNKVDFSGRGGRGRGIRGEANILLSLGGIGGGTFFSGSIGAPGSIDSWIAIPAACTPKRN